MSDGNGWTEERILQLIADEVPEDAYLEYKACAALDVKSNEKKIEVSKDISAFANADGGTIIYGVKEGQHGIPKGLDVGFDGISDKITREWLEQVVNSRIKPALENAKVLQVPLPKSSPGRYALAVNVGASVARGAHQAADHVYYQRHGSHNDPMDDYLVREVMHRGTAPLLEMRLVHDLPPYYFFDEKDDSADGYLKPFTITFVLTNLSEEPALYAHLKVFLDERVKIIEGAQINLSSAQRWPIDGKKHTVEMVLNQAWNVPAKMPIYKTSVYKLLTLRVALPAESSYEQDTFGFGWIAQSPRMAPRSDLGAIRLQARSIEIARGLGEITLSSDSPFKD